MKKQVLAVLAILCLTGSIIAQEAKDNKDESKLEFLISGKLGFARLNQSGNVPLNGNLTGTDVLLSYQFSPKWSLAGGIGYNEFNANMTVAGNTASLKNTYLQIPVQFNGNFSLFNKEKKEDEKIFLIVGVGLYANTLLKQEFESIGSNNEEKNLGWNFGLSSQVGAKFIISDELNIGIGIESQRDLTKMEKDGVKQRIDQYNGVYFKLGLTF